MMDNKSTKLARIIFLYLAALFVTSLVVSNLIFQKFIYWYPFNIDIFGSKLFELSVGILPYPITFLITDLTNRAYGKKLARKIVNIGFLIGILLTLFVSTNFTDYISVRIAIGSGTAFLVAQNIDINIFDKLREEKKWFIAPLVSSLAGSMIDTFIFFTIAFYKTEVPWVTLALGDFSVKLFIALTMLIPFRILLNKIKSISNKGNNYKIV